MKNTLYCYTRVSTKEQAIQGNSLDVQKNHGKQVADKLGMKFSSVITTILTTSRTMSTCLSSPFDAIYSKTVCATLTNLTNSHLPWQCLGHSKIIGKPPLSNASSAISTSLPKSRSNSSLCFRRSLRHAGCLLLTVCQGDPPVQGKLANTTTLGHRNASLTFWAPASDVKSSSFVISIT